MIPKVKIIKDTDAQAGIAVIVDGVEYRPGWPQAHNRVRIMLPEHVIKIERTIVDNCLDQTAQEAIIWERERYGKYGINLVPILKYELAERPFSGRDKVQYLIQPRVKFRPGRPSKKILDKAKEIITHLEERYGLCDLESDLVGFNWSIDMNGEPLIWAAMDPSRSLRSR